MGGGMSWGKFLIISLGLMLLTHVAHARDIESFTDSQGVLHITNPGAKRPGSPANPPGAPSSSPPPVVRLEKCRSLCRPGNLFPKLKQQISSRKRPRLNQFRLPPNPDPRSPLPLIQKG